MTKDNKVINIYRAIHIESGDTHFFVGTFDSETGEYVLPPWPRMRKVIGTMGRRNRFSSFAEAVGYYGYNDRAVAVQAATAKKEWGNTSRMVDEGWDTNLGEGYKPWWGRRRGRKSRA